MHQSDIVSVYIIIHHPSSYFPETVPCSGPLGRGNLFMEKSSVVAKGASDRVTWGRLVACTLCIPD